MMGVFVQWNEKSSRRDAAGYVIQENGCWDWVGGINPYGYGQLTFKGKKGYGAHRMMYERTKGPIPRGLEIDHLCRNRACVNPDHLEAVTKQENCLRGESMAGRNGRKANCLRGHPFTPENTALWNRKNGKRTRVCRTCRREKWADRAEAINARRRRIYGSR